MGDEKVWHWELRNDLTTDEQRHVIRSSVS
jgi:hypothetical protein